MRVAVTGSHGLVGRQLLPALEAAGHDVVRLVRGEPAGKGPGPAGAGLVRSAAATVAWDPATGHVERAGLAGVDAVVHLAGAGIGEHRWTPAYKQVLLGSRVQGTAVIARAVAGLDPPPAVLLSASAVGVYGDRGDELLSEASPPGSGFLAEVCRGWEEATRPAALAGVRTVLLRSGVVQAAAGGALRRQLPLFRLGLGGRLGRGRQWLSWIGLDDEVGAIVALLGADRVRGPVNLVAPEPVTNAAYAATLGRVLGRPARLAAPVLALQAVLGAEMASELLLASQRVSPTVLQELGYTWRHPRLEEALRAELHGLGAHGA